MVVFAKKKIDPADKGKKKKTVVVPSAPANKKKGMVKDTKKKKGT